MSVASYHIQTKPSICGPIAIHNVLKDKNLCCSIPSLNRLIRMCKTATVHLNNYQGTKPEDFECTLYKIFGYKNVNKISMRSFPVNYLDLSAVVLYAKKNGHAHYAYIKHDGLNYYLINHDDIDNDGVVCYKDYRELLEYLSEYRGDKWNLYRYPMIWRIRD